MILPLSLFVSRRKAPRLSVKRTERPSRPIFSRQHAYGGVRVSVQKFDTWVKPQDRCEDWRCKASSPDKRDIFMMMMKGNVVSAKLTWTELETCGVAVVLHTTVARTVRLLIFHRSF